MTALKYNHTFALTLDEENQMVYLRSKGVSIIDIIRAGIAAKNEEQKSKASIEEKKA